MSPPETTRETRTSADERPQGSVPLLALVLTGALRLREHPADAGESD